MRLAFVCHVARSIVPLLLVASITGCGGDNSSSGGTPGIAITLSPTSGTVGQGGSIPVTGTLIRSGGFAGNVTISVTGGPTDGSVTGTAGTPSGSGDSASVIVTIAASDSAEPGTYTLTVHASGNGVAQATASYQLTITAGAGYSLSSFPATLFIAPGGSGVDSVQITRLNYSGAVTLSLDGMPTGVTASFDPAAPTQASGIYSALTVTVASTVAPGTYPLTIRGVVSGRTDQTQALTLTVTAGGSFTLSASPPGVSVMQGGSAVDTIRVSRTGFTGSITMSTDGAPNGLTINFVPAIITDTVSIATVTASPSLPAGTDTVSIVATPSGQIARGAGLRVPVRIPLIVTVTPQSISGADLAFDWSGCATASTPLWVAAQDGAGAWTKLTPVGSTYTADFTQAKGGIAYVTKDASNNPSLNIQYFLTNAFPATTHFCPATSSRTASVTLAGMSAGELTYLSLGGASAYATTNGLVQFSAVPSGTVDFVGYKEAIAGHLGINDRFYQWGGLNPANGGSLGTTDVTTWSTPATATMTLLGLGTDIASHSSYLLSISCAEAYLYGGISVAGSSFTAYGAPEAQRGAGQGHRIGVFTVTTGGSTTGQRFLYQDMQALLPTTLMLPSEYPVPTITSQSGTFARPLFSVSQPADLNAMAYLSYTSTTAPYITTTITGSIGYNGSQSIAWAVPDLSGVTGFDPSWQMPAGSHFNWAIGGYNAGWQSLNGASCSSGNRAAYSVMSGSF